MLQRLNQSLGRAVYRSVGVLVGLAALAAFWAAWDAASKGDLASTLVPGAACGAFAWWCFRPERRLTDLEP